MSDWPDRVGALDIEHPNAARVYDYLLGGTTNWAIDRVFGDQLSELVPIIAMGARVNREFLGRAVRFALGSGITQFLDLGSGVPTVGDVHEVAGELDLRAGVSLSTANRSASPIPGFSLNGTVIRSGMRCRTRIFATCPRSGPRGWRPECSIRRGRSAC